MWLFGFIGCFAWNVACDEVVAEKPNVIIVMTDDQGYPILKLEKSEKIECIRYLEHGKKIKMVETLVQGIEIDTPEDLIKARSKWNEDNIKGKTI